MSIIVELLLVNLLAYFINLASNERSSAIGTSREKKLKEALEKEEELKKALAACRSIRDEVSAACFELSRSQVQLGVTAQEEPIWRLLADDVFQSDLTEWLMAGGIIEGNAAKERLLRALELSLPNAGENVEQLNFLKTGFFDAIEKAIFANPILANWRHQLSLDYLREQVAILRKHAEEAAGFFSPEKQAVALDSYCEKAFTAWDIIDLSNLPEGDIHIATQKLLLRQLYMPLRIEVELTRQGEGDEAVLARLEEEREARRHREAGHFIPGEPDSPVRRRTRVPVGERLAASRRLVVLGDPGGGKTTMLRWMATAYLLRHKGDAAFSQVPDTETLPMEPWIPVLIRCRDLGEHDLCRCFTDFLTQHLNKTELLPADAEVMRAVILDRIAKGKALLLVDGLDEITNPSVRMMFCQELERTAARYPDAPIVVTSRIVGYRDMPYRMGSGFEHGQIAELIREDKDLFAKRWVEITEQHRSKEEQAKRARELLHALHSNDRIERLTGNPMLLTTLALVKRKVGKLPNKRTKLYAEAVSVLLNWNPRLYQTIEDDEAIPQLEYLAYEMCQRGVQQLADDEVLDLLDRLRVEYPNIRAMKRREPQAFLKHLEERSSILIKSGGIWKTNAKKEKPVWEFRHLSFQEYLAARALLDGRYPGRDKRRSLAQQVSPLAGLVQAGTRRVPGAEPEDEVPESWREALRLLVADCKDDDVDEVMLSILIPAAGEDDTKTRRPRAVLATLCLADEPNVGEDTASQILEQIISQLRESDAGGRVRTSLAAACAELGRCIWAGNLKQRLMHEFLHRPPQARNHTGGLWAMVESFNAPDTLEGFEAWFAALVPRLNSGDDVERSSAALVVMESTFLGKACPVPGLIEALLAMLLLPPPLRFASAWALGRLCFDIPARWEQRQAIWQPNAIEVERLAETLRQTDWIESDTVRWLMVPIGCAAAKCALEPVIQLIKHADARVRRTAADTLAKIGDKLAVAPLLAKLDEQDKDAGRAVIEALGQLGDKQAVAPLLAKLDDPNRIFQRAAIKALGQLGDKQAVAPLLAKLGDQNKKLQQAAIVALGLLGDKQAIAPLQAKLDDKDEDIQQAVIEALGRLVDKPAEKGS